MLLRRQVTFSGRRRARLGVIALTLALLLATVGVGAVSAAVTTNSFRMVRSGGAVAAKCLLHGSGQVKIRSLGPVEIMDVEVSGLPPNSEYDLFVTQLPNPPFGVSWYQGDIETDSTGHGSERFIGRFNIETFAVAPGSGPAPVVHDKGPFKDASSNPKFAPIHTFHLGLWFGSPSVAKRAGCPTTVTPFNGVHNAGIQALSTRNFQNAWGPLRSVRP